MSGWDDNPMNFRLQYADKVIPTLVFDECKKCCVSEGTAESDVSAGMNLCLNNCYNKHATAFDLYMKIAQWKNTKKSIFEYVDIDEYAEMETQLEGDMYQQMKHYDKLKETPKSKKFFKDIKKEFGGLRSDAL